MVVTNEDIGKMSQRVGTPVGEFATARRSFGHVSEFEQAFRAVQNALADLDEIVAKAVAADKIENGVPRHVVAAVQPPEQPLQIPHHRVAS